MCVSFEVRCTIVLEPKANQKNSLKEIKTVLLPGNNIDKSFYFRNDELPNQTGAKAISNVLVQGLLSNIHYAHQENLMDSAEHLRWIISELERGFVKVTKVEPSIY